MGDRRHSHTWRIPLRRDSHSEKMKSAFGSKRKARKIQVDEDDEEGAKNAQVAELVNTSSTTESASSIPGRKTFKKSSLRQSIAFDDQSQDGDENDGPQVVNKPTIGRSSSLMKKKKTASSRLSFGPGEIISGDAAEALEDDEAFTPKKAALGRRVIEDEEGLDASELEGVMVVDLEDTGSKSAPAFIPSEAEIREKKERRARLANEQDFISFNDDNGSDRQQISLLPQKKKQESRLVREDEDLGEGFDEFVDDGRISLGKKQEREAKKRQRKEMADMIHQAEGSSDEDSDDSEAERRAAYETAQTRAGMDGLHKHDESADVNATQMPSKITPLPALSECLERLQSTLSSMEQELAKRQKQVEASKQEKNEIAAREVEVQELLKQAGARFAALKADTNGAVADPQSLGGTNNGFAVPMIVDRGLESFGNTPTVRPAVEDIG